MMPFPVSLAAILGVSAIDRERRGVSPPVQAAPGSSPLPVGSARHVFGCGCCSGPSLHRRAYAAPLAGEGVIPARLQIREGGVR
jgi:hypothetical protein